MNNEIYLICDYNEALTWANSEAGKSYLIGRNKNLKNLFPLTENFLRTYYVNTDFGNYKNIFKNINCASDTISFLTSSFGFISGGTNPNGANAAQSSGLNPFFGMKLNAGFDFGSLGSYLWILLVIGAVYMVKK